MSRRSRLFGVMVTYRRQSLLHESLAAIAVQTRPLDHLFVVDNEASPETRAIVEAFATTVNFPVELIVCDENVGSAGGWARGMEQALQLAEPNDWVMPLDDDDPPLTVSDFERIVDFADSMRRTSMNVGAVGTVGGRFDLATGLIKRVPDGELHDVVEVDFVGSGHTPVYAADALREAGLFDHSLFFGYTEIEYGMRLKKAGYQVLASGEMWRERRAVHSRCGIDIKPSWRCQITWKKYYVLRNYVYIMKSYGRWSWVVRFIIIQCLLKPAYTFFVSPLTGVRGFLLASRATFDGALSRMGKRMDPSRDIPGAPVPTAAPSPLLTCAEAHEPAA